METLLEEERAGPTMLLSMEFVYLSNLVSAVLCCLIGSFAIIICVTQKVREIGSYRYLLVAYSAVSVLQSLLSYVAQPIVQAEDSAFFVFSLRSWGNRQLGQAMLVLYCTLTIEMFFLLCFHFFYRYITVCRPRKVHWFRGKNAFIWPSVLSLIGGFWSFYVHANFGPSEFCDIQNSTQYIRELLNDSMSQVVYIGKILTKKSSDSSFDVRWDAVVEFGFLFSLHILTFFGVFVFGVSVFRSIARRSTNRSKRTKIMHQQLFLALIIQTILPTCMVYAPMFCAVVFQFVDIDLPVCIVFYTLGVVIYPPLDQVVNLVVIREYRRAAQKLLMPWKNKPPIQINATLAWLQQRTNMGSSLNSYAK